MIGMKIVPTLTGAGILAVLIEARKRTFDSKRKEADA
jgi:hypothetical protein